MNLMNMMRKLMISCDKATFLITKAQEGEISFIEKIDLELHLMACKFCKLFRKQSSFLSDNVEHLGKHPNESLPNSKLTDARKAAIQQALQEELNKDSEK